MRMVLWQGNRLLCTIEFSPSNSKIPFNPKRRLVGSHLDVPPPPFPCSAPKILGDLAISFRRRYLGFKERISIASIGRSSFGR